MADSEIVQRILALSEGVTSGEELLRIDLARKGSLDWSPKENWVDQEGGLPKYIEEIALAIMRGTGKKREEAIPIAISRVKKWATGVGVKADTQAKAVAALAQWMKMRASAKARPNKK